VSKIKDGSFSRIRVPAAVDAVTKHRVGDFLVVTRLMCISLVALYGGREVGVSQS